ncbi:MAG TPA: hypothetical protein VGV65_03470 [Nocardioides sp.]|nr:hypothetical protein [Nocardioides sp.]
MQSMNRAGAAVGLAVFAAAMWVAWFGWDDVPYAAWQVVGCGLSICAAAVLSLVLVGRGAVLLAGAAAVGFAIPWAVYAASTDDSGLWAVGLVMLLAGSFIGLVVLLTVTEKAFLRRQP